MQKQLLIEKSYSKSDTFLMFGLGMKVALIHIRYIYKGGLETRLFNYIDYFLKRGDEVHLFTSKISPDIEIPQKLIIHFVDLKIIPKPIRNFIFDKKLKKALNRNDFDFILSLERTSRQYHVIAPSTHKGYLVAKGNFIYDFIDMLQIYLDKKSFSSAKIVYACSEMIKAEIQDYYKIEEKQIKVLYPPINVAKFNKLLSKESAKKTFNLKNDKRYFLLVSTSHKRKGLDLLQKVFKKLPQNYVLLVAGTPFDSDVENIVSLGFIKNVEVLYRAVDYLLHPAVYEPFGQIITEAFATRIPVIVSNKVGAKEFVNSTNGVVVETYNVDEWVKAIIELENQSFSFEGIEQVLENLSLEKHMELMLNWAIVKK